VEAGAVGDVQEVHVELLQECRGAPPPPEQQES
jgi:hypothetical protein